MTVKWKAIQVERRENGGVTLKFDKPVTKLALPMSYADFCKAIADQPRYRPDA